jgi:hydroxymethylpyrimidine pyrophosphatase-like HAD family hydrolase
MNDYSAFQVVKHSIATANADKKILASATHVTKEAKDHGAGHAVNYLLTDV